MVVEFVCLMCEVSSCGDLERLRKNCWDGAVYPIRMELSPEVGVYISSLRWHNFQYSIYT